MLFQICFGYLNVIYCSVLSLIIAFGYNDVSLLKHAEISVTWYEIQHKKVYYIIYNIIYNMEAKVTCFSIIS